MKSPSVLLEELQRNGLDTLLGGGSLTLKDAKAQCDLIDELMNGIILPLKLSTDEYKTCPLAKGFYEDFDLGTIMFVENTRTLNWYKILHLKPSKKKVSLDEYLKPISMDQYDPAEAVMRTYRIDETHPLHMHAMHRAQKETLPYGHYPQLFFLSLYRSYFLDKSATRSNPDSCFVFDFLEVLLREHPVPYLAKKANTRHEDIRCVYNVSAIISFCTTFLGRYIDLLHTKSTVTFPDIQGKKSETINLRIVYAEIFRYLVNAPLINLMSLKTQLSIFWINAGAGSPEAITYNYASDSSFQMNSDTFPAPKKAVLKKVFSGSYIIYQSEPKDGYLAAFAWLDENNMPTLSKLMRLYLMWPLNAKACSHHYVLSLIHGLYVTAGFGRTDIMQAYGTIKQLPVAPIFTEHLEKVMYNTLLHYAPKLPDDDQALAAASKMWKNSAAGFPSKTKVKVTVEEQKPVDVKITSKINHSYHDGLNMFKRDTILKKDDETTFTSIDNFVRDRKVLKADYDLDYAGQITTRQVVGGKATRLVYKMPLHVVNFEAMLLNTLLRKMDKGGASDKQERDGVIIPAAGNIYSGDVSDAGQKALDTTPLIFATGVGEQVCVSADAKSYDTHQQMENLFLPIFNAFHRYYATDPRYNQRYKFGHVESFSPRELIFITLCSYFKSDWIVKVPILRCKIDYDTHEIHFPKNHSDLWWFPNQTRHTRSISKNLQGSKDFSPAKDITDLFGFTIIIDDVEIDELTSPSVVHVVEPEDTKALIALSRNQKRNEKRKEKKKGRIKTEKDKRNARIRLKRRESCPYPDTVAVDNNDVIAHVQHLPSGSKFTFHMQSVETISMTSVASKEIMPRFFGSPLWKPLAPLFADLNTPIDRLCAPDVVLIIDVIVDSIVDALLRDDRSQPKASSAEMPIDVENLSAAGDDAHTRWKAFLAFRYSYITKKCNIASYTIAGHEVNSFKFGVSNVAADYCQTYAFAGFYVTVNKLIIESSENPKGSPEDPQSIIASAKRVILTMVSRGMSPQFCLVLFIAISKWHNIEEYRFLSNSPFLEYRLLMRRKIGNFKDFLFNKETTDYIKARHQKYKKGISNAKIGKVLLMKPTYQLLLPSACGGAALNFFFLYIEMTQALVLSLYNGELLPLMSIMFHAANTKLDDSFLYSIDTPAATSGLFQQLAEPSVRSYIKSKEYDLLLEGRPAFRRYTVTAIANKTFKESMALESGLKRIMPKRNDMRFSAYMMAITNFNLKQAPIVQSKFWYKGDLFARGYRFIVTPTPVPKEKLKPTFITPIASLVSAQYVVYGVVDSQTKRVSFTDSLRKILSRNGLTSHITPELIEGCFEREKINLYNKDHMVQLLRVMGISIRMANEIFEFYTRTHSDGSGVSLSGVGTDEVTRVVRLFESREHLDLWKSLGLDGPSSAQINNLYSQLALFFTSAHYIRTGKYVRMDLRNIARQMFPTAILQHMKMNTQEYSANFVFEDLEVALRTSERR